MCCSGERPLDNTNEDLYTASEALLKNVLNKVIQNMFICQITCVYTP